jgi:putative tryptophan/tyrosine transport system substrate-binding protein
VRRRKFITLLGGAAAWPLAARAQDAGKVARIGFLGPAQTSAPAISFYQAFLSQMRELGFRDGQNLRVEYRAIEDPRGISAGAEELVHFRPELIVATGPEVSLRAVVGASGNIPIVMIAINFDPIARGYVASLARPGGNITGVVFQQLELAQKQVEVLAQANPGKTRVAILFDGVHAVDQFGAAERAAQSLNLQVQGLKLESPAYDFDVAFRSAAMASAQMALILSGPGFTPHRSPSECHRDDHDANADDLGDVAQMPRARPLADEILQKGRRRNWPLRIGDRFQRRGQRQADGVIVDLLQAVAVPTQHAGRRNQRSRARE